MHPRTPSPRPRGPRRLVAGTAPVLGLVLLLTACGTDDAAGGGATPGATPDAVAPDVGPQDLPPDGGGFGGGTSGEIVAVTGTTMQVQGSGSQTAVTWDGGTAFTQTLAASLADVSTGVCVTVVPAPDAASAGTSGDATATGVAISEPVDGACTAGGGFAGGGPPAGRLPEGAPTDAPAAGGGRPEGMPTDAPEGAPPGGGGFGIVSGRVTAVDGTSVSVDVTSPDGSTATSTVTVDDATTYTRTTSADATAVVVGLCVVARGEADDSGAVTATSVLVSARGDEGCTTRPGGGRGGAGGPGVPGGGEGGQGREEGSDDA